MKGVLIYVGAVAGGELLSLIDKYDKILAVQALSSEAVALKQSLSAFPHVQVVHGAVTRSDKTVATLHVASNALSSSIGTFRDEWLDGRGLKMVLSEQVP